jgi:hypothetical protein
MNLTAPCVTDIANGMSLHDLASDKAKLKIPPFQRSYAWGRNQWPKLNSADRIGSATK